MKILIGLILSIVLFAQTDYTQGTTNSGFEELCKNKKPIVIAVTSVAMSNRSAKLVFDAEGVQDLVTLAIEQSNCYTIIDWQHLSDVIEHQQLHWNDINNDEKARAKLQKELQIDYFLDTDISNYALDTEYSNSAFSKEKQQKVSLSVSMKLKNALTNKYVETISNDGFANKKVEHSLGFGTNANNSNNLNNVALKAAIQKNMQKLVKTELVKLDMHQNEESITQQIDLNNISESLKALVASSSQNECPGKFISTSGYATSEKGYYQGKKRSLMDAYRNAIGIGTGVKINSKSELTMTDDMTKAFTTISKSSQGFISYYEILSQGMVKPNLFQTDIKACVNTTDPTESSKYLGLQQYVTMMGNPTLLIVLDEENDKNKNSDNSLNTHTIEIAMGEYFQALGYQVILSDDLLGRDIATKEQIVNAREGSSGYAIELARASDADFLIVGNLKYDIKEKKISNTTGKLISLSFNAKAVFPGSGRSAKLYTQQDSSMMLIDQGITDREKLLKKNAIAMANTMAWEMPSYLLDEERDIEMKLTQVSYKTYKKIIAKLKKEKMILDVQTVGRWKRAQNKLGSIRLLVKTSYLGIVSDDLLTILESYNYSPDIDYIGQHNASFVIGK